jgi:hypothetical protein
MLIDDNIYGIDMHVTKMIGTHPPYYKTSIRIEWTMIHTKSRLSYCFTLWEKSTTKSFRPQKSRR